MLSRVSQCNGYVVFRTCAINGVIVSVQGVHKTQINTCLPSQPHMCNK